MDMTELCGTSNCSSSHSSSLTLSLTSMPGGVEETTATAPPSDPLNVMGRVGGVVISLTIVTGLVGNVLVLLAIVHCPQLRRSYNAFIASLSVTDLVCVSPLVYGITNVQFRAAIVITLCRPLPPYPLTDRRRLSFLPDSTAFCFVSSRSVYRPRLQQNRHS